jgi:hypothetical protein
MLHYLFTFILLVHGLIHLMGFAKAFHLAEFNQLTQPISRAAGVFWLLAAVLFLLATVLFLQANNRWWLVILPAIVLSQVLIVMAWGDAKFGTIANLIILLVAAEAFGSWNFNSMTESELKALLRKPLVTTSVAPKAVLTKEMTAYLPPVVQKWLERSHVMGKEMMHTVRIEQQGTMRTSPTGAWMNLTAEQFNTIDEPSFIWKAKAVVAPLIYIAARDKYVGGKGNMFVQLMSLYPIADAKGTTIDQGSMLRYLAEICLFPTAVVSNYIRWEALDSLSARATMSFGGVTASGLFRFTADGDMVSFEAQRYYDRKEGATLEDWLCVSKGWKDFHGIRVTNSFDIIWKLKAGDYFWLNVEVTDMEFNIPNGAFEH